MGNREIAVKLYNSGVTTSNDKSHPSNLSTAYTQFVSAAYADPTWSTAFYQAGNNASDLNHLHTAVACYWRALECSPDPAERARILCNLSWRLHGTGRIAEALDLADRALAIEPTLPLAHLNRAQALGAVGRNREGVEAARRGFELDAEQALKEGRKPDPVIEMCLAFQLLFNRQFAEGFRHFESRFTYKLHSFLYYPYPKWTGEPDGTLFLVADQGLGDTISFARFVPLAAKRARYIHCCIQPELLTVFQEAFVGLPNVNLLPSPTNFPAADYWSTFVSLPFALSLTDDEIRNTPHVTFRPESRPAPWKVTDRTFHVGIQWAGSSLNDINVHRSIPLPQFLDLYRVPGIQLYSLQVDDSRKQLAEHGVAPVVQDLSGFIRDVADTLSTLKHLDLVICCESALGHICALAGKDCWIAYSYLGRDYRASIDGKDPIWTPRHRFFSQGPEAKWQPVFDEIVKALRVRVDEYRGRA